MNKYIHIFLFILLLVCSCTETETDRQLNEIDSLLQKECNDSAYKSLKRIDAVKLSEEQTAHYNLLKTIAFHKLYLPITSDSLIGTCVDYYKNKRDKRKLAWSYLYKGNVQLELGKTDEAILNIKEAENIAKDLEDLELSIRVNVFLAYVNTLSGNYQLAIKYGKKTLGKAKTACSKRWMCYALDHLAAIFSFCEQMDSCYYYREQVLPYVNDAPEREKANVLSNLAQHFFNTGRRDSTEKYYLLSLQAFPTVEAYGKLAQLYEEQNRDEEAEKLWKTALTTKSLRMKIAFLNSYSHWQQKRGLVKEANETTTQIIALKDSLTFQQRTEEIKEIQDRYEKEQQENRYYQRILFFSVVIVVLIVIYLILWLRHKMKLQRAEKENLENQLLIDSYSRRIKELEVQGKDRGKEVQALRSKIEELHQRQQETLAQGKHHYDSIIDGGTVSTWRKEDFVAFLSYYATVNPTFVIETERQYKALSPGNKFFLSLIDMGKTDEELRHILGLTQGAIRTKRYRISGKRR